MLVFINPFGGKGRGKRVYERKVAPLFALAAISTEVIGKADALQGTDEWTGERFKHGRWRLVASEVILNKIEGVVFFFFTNQTEKNTNKEQRVF